MPSLKWPAVRFAFAEPAVVRGLPHCFADTEIGCFMTLDAGRVESENPADAAETMIRIAL
jgi:hypothetical protein